MSQNHKAEVAERNRLEIIRLWLTGCYNISDIARKVGVSRPTVYKAIQAYRDARDTNILTDGRRANGRPPVYEPDPLIQAVASIRSRHPEWGPMLIHHELFKHKERYGIDPVPSPETIKLVIRELGLARKPIGPADKRVYPDVERPNAPGYLTIDTYGPWCLKATNLWLVTIQDRWSRIATAVPAWHARYDRTGIQFGPQTMMKAIACARKYILNGGVIDRLYTDNGIGLMPVNGHIPPALRYALANARTVVYIPPGQPWRNGRLERFHYSLQREFFFRERPSKVDACLQGLREYLNWYNHERPHRACGFITPSDRFPVPLLPEDWYEIDIEPVESVGGLIECIRLVENSGRIRLWTEEIFVSDMLGGQYVRVQLWLSDGSGVMPGRVIWQRKRGEDIVVAELEHSLGSGKDWIHACYPVDMIPDIPSNQVLDEVQEAKARARRSSKAFELYHGDAG